MQTTDAAASHHRKSVSRAPAYALYTVALITSAVVTFGATGIWAAALIAAAWGYVVSRRSRPMALLHVVALAIAGWCLLSPCFATAREAARRTKCRNNLHDIALALHNYHDVYRSFPPAYTTDENGQPMHSWRVLILPYIDQALYVRFRLDEPWDSPHNLELARQFPDVYACPARSHRHDVQEYTSYVAVVGDGTAWPHPHARRISEFTDGTSNTILVVEYDSGVLWTEPRDLEFEDALDVLAAPDPDWMRGHCSADFFYEHYDGTFLAMADGAVRYQGFGGDREFWSSLLIVNDGAPRDASDAQPPYSEGESRLRIGNCIRLTVFTLLVLLPLPSVWLNPTSGRTTNEQ